MAKVFIFFISCLLLLSATGSNAVGAQETPRIWEIQSIDTMKYSRDQARNMANDKAFEQTIQTQIQNIAATGATHVAIATPYDDEFYPFLKKWVTEARANKLKVWFRGNFAGWEGWFNYPRISREQHLEKMEHFILAHPDIFADGDIFTPCPECENGGPGDPRKTQDVEGHRLFLISEHRLAQGSFLKIGKKVNTSVNSMNADVARLIMNEKTTKELGGIVAIDHYVSNPEKLVRDIEEIAASSQGNIFLGEFGVPIPDIHGNYTEEEQAAWLAELLPLLSQQSNVVGLNYWVNIGGSTAIWKDNNEPLKAVKVLTSFYKPSLISGRVVNAYNYPIGSIKVSNNNQMVLTNKDGRFKIINVLETDSLSVLTQRGESLSYSINPDTTEQLIVIGKVPQGFINYLLGYISSLFTN